MYQPHRDRRFEYVWEVMSFIEDNQCGTCAFKNPHGENTIGEPYMMCGPIEYELTVENPVEGLDDVGDDGVVCRLYREETLVEQEHPDQLRLL
jgi:hypothetical protein